MKTALTDSKYEIAKPNYRCSACDVEIDCELPYFSAIFFHQAEFTRRDYCEGCWDHHASGQPLPSRAPDVEGAAPPADSAAAAAASGAEGGDVLTESGPQEATETGTPYAFWRTRRPPLPTDQPRKVRFDVELALQFFRSVAGGAEESAAAGQQEDVSAESLSDDGSVEVSASSGQDGETSDVDESGDVAVVQASATDSEQAEATAAAPTAPGSVERDQIGFVVALLLIRKKVLTLNSTAARDGEEYLKVTERKEPERSAWIRNPQLNAAELERVKVRLGDLLHMQV